MKFSFTVYKKDGERGYNDRKGKMHSKQKTVGLE